MIEFLENHRFGFFWGMIILLGVIEFFAPDGRENRNRESRWLANFSISVFSSGIQSAIISSLLPASLVLMAGWASNNQFGLLNLIPVPFWAAAIATVAAKSLAAYFLHYLSHTVPWLWRIHSVHHSDFNLDVTTYFRSHPLENLNSFLYMSFVIVLLGLPPDVLAIYYLAEHIIVVISHSNVRIPAYAENCLQRCFVTPKIHSIHHSAERAETDSNYGNVFVIWDRIFGTYRDDTVHGGPVRRFGLSQVSQDNAHSLNYMLMQPFVIGADSGDSETRMQTGVDEGRDGHAV